MKPYCLRICGNKDTISPEEMQRRGVLLKQNATAAYTQKNLKGRAVCLKVY